MDRAIGAPTDGAVAAGTVPAARIGAETLARGGNAVDAAVAAALAMAVADPANTSVAGRCHVLVAFPNGRAVAIDGRTALPAAFARTSPPKEASGPGVVPVPGNPATLHQVAGRFGRVPWADLCNPARDLAASGFQVPRCLGSAWQDAAPSLRADPGARCLFLRGDDAPPRGSLFAQPALAPTLHELGTQGPAAIMDGPRARRIVSLLGAGGSVISQADLAEYQPLEGELVRFPYRGWTVSTIGRQGYGYTLAQTLGILSRFSLNELDEDERWLTVLLAQRVARQDRPGQETDPADHLLADGLLDSRARRVRALIASGPQAVLGCFGSPPARPDARRGDTTHISAVDASGLACAITTSIGPHFGALVAAPRDGFLFAHSYRMAEGDRRARRDRTEMLPTVLIGPAGERVVLGAAGSSRIPGAVLRAIVAIIDQGRTPAQAVHTSAAVWHDGRISAHPEVGSNVIRRLEQAGLPLDSPSPPRGRHFGLLHLVAMSPGQPFTGAADLCWDGAAWVSVAGQVRPAEPVPERQHS